MRQSVVIDTDPGLDDAVAILFALSVPAFDIRLITSVAGNIGLARTTENVGRLLAVTGARHVPYAAGASGPLDSPAIHEERIHGADGLGGVALPDPLEPAGPDAVGTLAALLSAEEPGTITALTLGPLTNLALLRRKHPDAFARLKRIVAMGGAINEPGNVGPHAEFNIAADPLAAQIVLSAGVPVTLIPLDVTRRVRATPADLRQLDAYGTTAAHAASALIQAYFTGASRESRPLHDPCVMLLALAPLVFSAKAMTLSVDLSEHPGRLVEAPGGAPVEVAMQVDPDAALALLWRGLGGGLTKPDRS